MRLSGWIILLLVVTTGGLLLLGAPAANAQTAKVLIGNASALPGGEFNVMVVDNTGLEWETAAGTSPLGYDFPTFCVQTQNDFTPGQVYEVVVNTWSLGPGPNDTKALDSKTAFLFDAFNNKTLSYGGYAYDYSLAGNSRKQDASVLQALLWEYQGQTLPAGYKSGWSVEQSAEYAAWKAEADTDPWAGGIGQVRIMNLYGSIPSHQNQLIELPSTVVPEPGTMAASLALLTPGGISAALWKIRRRRQS
jgi:hypothetical protein